jgi:O-succinylbenzoate synthase
MSLQLEKIELCEIEMPLVSRFETSFGVATGRRVLLVRVWDADGAAGWGECTAMDHPFYNHETIDTAWSIITDFIAPMLKAGKVSNAADVAGVLKPIQGNRMAIGGVETAIWDLEAKKAGVPLWRHLGGTAGEIDCGVSIGIQKSPEVLLETVARELESGYQRIKLKIKPGQDYRFVAAVRSRFPGITLSVDANSAYDLGRDIGLFERLDHCGLLMIEQPLAAGDLVDHAKLQKRLKTPVCLDESITSLTDARHALELGACRIINIKLGRVGGHSEARAIQSHAAARSIPVWCGGMLETGIGRAHNIAMSTLAGFTLPGDVSASARYWQEDIIEPPVVVSPQGTITAPTGPGIGYEVKENLIEKLTIKRDCISLA